MTFDRALNLLTFICTVLIVLMAYQDFRRDRGQPELKMSKTKWVIMVLIGLLPLATLWIYSRYFIVEIPEFDAIQEQGAIISYGTDGPGSPGSCVMTVNGKAFESRKVGYKLAVGCFVYGGEQDILDAPYLQVSSLYGITPGEIYMRASLSPEFLKYFKERHAIGVDIVLLNVPNSVQTSQFTTLRQARGLGVRIPVLTVYKGYQPASK